MAGGGGPIPKGTFKVVRYVTLNQTQLSKIAEILGIPENERGEVFSGEVHIVPESITRQFPGKKRRRKKP
jgi:hypothetical protein